MNLNFDIRNKFVNQLMCKNKLFWHFPLKLQGQRNLKYINLNVNFTNKLYILLKNAISLCFPE